MNVLRYKSTLLLSVLAIVMAAPACMAAKPATVAKANLSIPPDDGSIYGTKQLAGRTAEPGLNLTYDYDTFNYTVVNGRKSKEGYPIYAMECNFRGDRQCFGEAGQPLGTIEEVAGNITTVSNKDVLRRDWYCDHLCVDSQDIIVGAVSPQMRAWLNRRSLSKSR